MFGISRIDSGHTHSWFVRIYNGDKHLTASFSDNKNGGKRKALRAAKLWRDEHVADIDTPRRGPPPSLEHKRSWTGVAGVQLVTKRENGKLKSVMWAAIWREKSLTCGKSTMVARSKSFSVIRYGYRGAFLWAAYTRASKIGMTIELRKLITPPPPKKLLRWLESRQCLTKRVRYGDFLMG